MFEEVRYGKNEQAILNWGTSIGGHRLFRRSDHGKSLKHELNGLWLKRVGYYRILSGLKRRRSSSWSLKLNIAALFTIDLLALKP